MNIGGFQKLSLLDFPSEVACIVFTSGCSFRCPFCHNAELVTAENKPSVDESDVFEYLEKRRGILDGVVITGGEPLMQADIADFILKVRSYGMKIKLDTNGCFPEKLNELLNDNLLDYIAMDIKHTAENYSIAVGADCTHIMPKIKKSIKMIKNCGIPAEFRTTLVKGIHCTADAAAIAGQLRTDLPYFLQSYVDSGSVISPTGLEPFSQTELELMLKDVRQFCPNTALRGV